MKFLSVCSGIEAASVAWKPLGWEPVAFAEIEAFPSSVLTHHYRGVPNWGDMTKFREWPDAAFDVLVGGTPCQSFSVAGLRKGLVDPRGNLCLVYLAIADRYRPKWIAWENVPGVLSSGGGRDFGSFIGGLGELGYHAAWRVLDAQYVRVDGLERAVPQRRRRVFVVGCLGDWRRAAAVLFESESMRGDNPPRRQAGQRVAPTVEARANAGGSGWGTDFLAGGGMASVDDSLVVGAVSSKWSKGTGGPAGDECYNLVADPICANEARTLTAFNIKGTPATKGGEQVDVHVPLRARQPGQSEASTTTVVATTSVVRRLTPRECERLQGFPDDFTLVTYRGKPAADGPRYKALGNSMAVNVMRWIGRRIELVDGLSA